MVPVAPRPLAGRRLIDLVMRVLYIGPNWGTSGHRAAALKRLGHEVLHLDPEEAVPRHRWVRSLNVRTGYLFFLKSVERWIQQSLGDTRVDLAWVNGGEAVRPSLVRWLRKRCGQVINYNNDDPFGRQNFKKWAAYLRAVPEYDMLVVMRAPNISEAKMHGCRRVARVFMSYDPVAHAPQDLSDSDRARWRSEVLFVGTWMPERGPFLEKLVKLGVPLTIWGENWKKSPEFNRLQPCIRGPSLVGADYVKAIQCARVALGLLSVGNRDLHTQRSAEVPFIGTSLFCAQRTSEHAAMYREDEEALFWSSPEECAEKCAKALADEYKRKRIAAAAQKRIADLKMSNDETVLWILDALRSSGDELERCVSQN